MARVSSYGLEPTVIYTRPPERLPAGGGDTLRDPTPAKTLPFAGLAPELLLLRFRAILTAFLVASVLITIDSLVWGDHLWLRVSASSALALAWLAVRLIRQPTVELMVRLEWICLVSSGVVVTFLVTVFALRAAWHQGESMRVTEVVEHGFIYAVMGAIAYATLIPAPPRRTIGIVAFCSLAPGLLALILALVSPPVRERLDPERLVTSATLSGAMAFIVGYAASVINALRREVRDARKLGQYVLREPLGEGGMGEVFRAEHAMLKRPCAIKLIRAETAGDPGMLMRFEQEVQATANLSHPNTVEVYDYGRTEDGTFYYVMELLPGLSLEELVDQYGPMPPARVVHFLQAVCGALAEAHAEGMIHRDVKPANIFAARRGGVHDVAKLLDFGLVKQGGLDEAAQGEVSGSPLYMAPEQGMGRPEQRSDLYALGATGYFLLTGQTPFTGTSILEVMTAHAVEEPTPPSRVRDGVPADLEQILLRTLAKSPSDRYASAWELGEALGRCACAGQWTHKDAEEWWATRDQIEPKVS